MMALVDLFENPTLNCDLFIYYSLLTSGHSILHGVGKLAWGGRLAPIGHFLASALECFAFLAICKSFFVFNLLLFVPFFAFI